VSLSRIDTMIVAMAHEVKNGEFWAQGIATPMTAAALMLAKRTHAPKAMLGYAIGNSTSDRSGPLSITRVEELTLTGCLKRWSFADATREFLPFQNPHEFLRPAQVDATGATNNICLGPWEKPKVRLPGCGGIADVTPYSRTARLYVPRHNAKTLVAQLDFRSGMGHLSREERDLSGVVGPGPRALFTDLGVFHWPGGTMEILALHDGVTVDEVVASTGFTIPVPGEIKRTRKPSDEELRILREEIDPNGLRELESLGTRERMVKLAAVLAAER
jgi:acyl CoA:acetate/3-ketoacid CoA transferase beta subunit